MFLTLGLCIIVVYKLTQQTLITNTLEINQGYAEKVAKTTEQFFNQSKSTLSAYSAEMVTNRHDPEELQHEIDEIYYSSKQFNSVLFADPNGRIITSSPQSLNLKNQTIKTAGSKQALQERSLIVSDPHKGISGKLTILVSTPVWGRNGEYLGFLGGSILLEENDALDSILKDHFYQDDSYLFVVCPSGNIIYHPNLKRIGESVIKNEAVQQVLKGKQGARRVLNTQNMDMLAGYSPVKSSGWGIISQTPTESTVNPSTHLIKYMLLYTSPFFLLFLFLALWLAKTIITPLKELAAYSENLCVGDFKQPMPNISPWYKEAEMLYKATALGVNSLKQQINHLSKEAYTDPLTQLANQRTIRMLISDWIGNHNKFAIIFIDLDSFKKVNDTYGHDTGDQVLKFLAKTMESEVRKQDICCRYGGEEFVILLPETNKHTALNVAERVRRKMAITPSPTGKIVTLSAGVAAYPADGDCFTDLFKAADKALYQAKRQGRNRIVVVE